MTKRRATGCLIGLALGDALGAPVEFLDIRQIYQRFPPRGPQEPPGDPARVTDDTQMTLALARALHQVGFPPTVDKFEPLLRQAFVAWSQSPENNRAPGRTCMTACQRLAAGERWQQATVAGSKGCGANMRVAPVALFSRAHDLDRDTCAALAQFQAALTHGHPTALAAADLTARTIVLLLQDASLTDLPGLLRAYAQSQRTVYYSDWLGDLWERAFLSSPQEYTARGWDECLAILDRLDTAVRQQDRETDPCLQTGAGWIAEEAFATGLLCFLLFPHDPVAALRRAAATSGDSDSIACLTGAFAGAFHGLGAWPGDWVARIEYRAPLMALGSAWE